MRTHRDVGEVEAICKKADEKHTFPMYASIRIRGDDVHNSAVCHLGEGELLLSRRPTSPFNTHDYGPCPNCREWMLMRTITRHQKRCTSKTSTRASKKELLIQADIFAGRIQTKPSKALCKEVFSIMTRDKVSKLAQNDQLIVCLGEEWLRQNFDNKANRKYYTSQRIRANSRLLIELQTASDVFLSC